MHLYRLILALFVAGIVSSRMAWAEEMIVVPAEDETAVYAEESDAAEEADTSESEEDVPAEPSDEESE